MNTTTTAHDVATPADPNVAAPARWVVPAIDVLTKDSDLRVRVDVPGVTAERLTIHARDGVLTLSAVRADRSVGYRRQLRLPEQIDVSGIRASLAHGVLTLDLPAAEASRPRTIQVQVG